MSQLNQMKQAFELLSDGNLTPAVAIKQGWFDVAEALIQSGSDIDITDEMMDEVSKKGPETLLNILIDRGGNINAGENSHHNILVRTIHRKFEETTKKLLEMGVVVNDESHRYSPALQAALRISSTELVGMMIDHGADVGEGHRGESLLFSYSIGAGRKDIVEYLLDKLIIDKKMLDDALTDAVDHHCARTGCQEEIMNLLIDRGASPANATYNNRPLLMWLVQIYHAEPEEAAVIDLLIKRGADINARDKGENTILIEAARNKQADIAAKLIIAGADLNALNKNKQSFWDFAAMNDPVVHQALQQRLASEAQNVPAVTMG